MSQIPVVVVRWNLEMLLSHEARITRIETETKTLPSDQRQRIKTKQKRNDERKRNINRRGTIRPTYEHTWTLKAAN